MAQGEVNTKLLVIISTSDKEEMLTALMYAGNAKKHGWMEDIKVVFFGPSEKLVVDDAEISTKVIEVASTGDSFACKAISDRDGISNNLERLGVRVEYVGPTISDFIKEGYAPMVW
jgi:hypothetical protein